MPKFRVWWAAQSPYQTRDVDINNVERLENWGNSEATLAVILSMAYYGTEYELRAGRRDFVTRAGEDGCWEGEFRREQCKAFNMAFGEPPEGFFPKPRPSLSTLGSAPTYQWVVGTGGVGGVVDQAAIANPDGVALQAAEHPGVEEVARINEDAFVEFNLDEDNHL